MAANGDWISLFQKRLGRNALGPEERDAVARAYVGIAIYRAADEIVADADGGEPLHLVTRGWAARVCRLEDGSSQITDFVLPGELCDLSRLNGSFGAAVAITQVSVALLNRRAMLKAIATYPKIGLALLRLALSEQAILREWLLCLGLRDKREHLAHLLCELHERLRRAGLVTDHEFDLPLTQEQLAEAMGMTAVHTNRVVQALRRDGIISLGQRRLTIHEPAHLQAIGKFDSSYLTD